VPADPAPLRTSATPAGARSTDRSSAGAAAVYWTFARPFTLIPPMTGIFSGALIGYGAMHVPFPIVRVSLAVIAAAVLNAASNGLNQIYDLDNDRINKPARPLPAGQISTRQAWRFVALTYTAALVLAACVNWQTLAIYAAAALSTIAYSVPPVRLKQRPIASNVIIAAVRGCLLKVAGWAAVATVLHSIEPWYIGLVYCAFLLGATTTKDFADIEGDRAANCMTLPVRYGAAWSARMISPAFILPWVLLPLGVRLHVLTGNPTAIRLLALVMIAWGSLIVLLINRDPHRLVADGENHPAWRHMYLMMIVGHLGLSAAYLLG
jgi:4-hydroxybenzoate polyprenyltransferase